MSFFVDKVLDAGDLCNLIYKNEKEINKYNTKKKVQDKGNRACQIICDKTGLESLTITDIH